MAAVSSPTDAQKILEEYKYLLEKSHQLFAGLRDVPQFGKQWQPYFQRTFEVYSKLWKFQQIHRATLENKEYYGLKRSEIGEIASKIGQLYYHYYLRTSDINYLHESFVFYDAIRSRGYFKEVLDAKSPMMTVKKLRYYARFIVVCLLLHRRALVKELAEELQKLVDDYVRGYRPADAQEWQMLLQEVIAFLQAEGVVTVTPQDKNFILSNRLRPLSLANATASASATTSTNGSSTTATKPRLQEAILVGNYSHQVKFSELTLDMFRMMLALEKETTPLGTTPTSSSSGASSATSGGPAANSATSSSSSSSTAPAASGGATPSAAGAAPAGPAPISGSSAALRRPSTTTAPMAPITGPSGPASGTPNPHKYLLYRPTVSQLLTFLATAAKELAATDHILLLYLSANCLSPASSSSASGGAAAADLFAPGGGIPLNPGNASLEDDSGSSSVTESGASMSTGSTLPNYHLYPGDILPYARRRMFLVVDSPNAAAFRALPTRPTGSVFQGSSLACLLAAPGGQPGYLKDATQMGGLLTFFLYAPLLAFCYVCSVSTMPRERFDACQEFLTGALDDLLTRLVTATTIASDSSYAIFLEDEFLGTFLARFLLFEATSQVHREFAGKTEYRPIAHPAIPLTDELNTHLRGIVTELATRLNVSDQLVGAPS